MRYLERKTLAIVSHLLWREHKKCVDERSPDVAEVMFQAAVDVEQQIGAQAESGLGTDDFAGDNGGDSGHGLKGAGLGAVPGRVGD